MRRAISRCLAIDIHLHKSLQQSYYILMIRPQRGTVGEMLKDIGNKKDELFTKNTQEASPSGFASKDESNNNSNNNNTDSSSDKTKHNKTPSSLDKSSILQNIVLIVFAVGLAVMWCSAVALEKIAFGSSRAEG